MIEIDFVANIEAQSDRSEKRFKTRSRVKNTIDVAGPQVRYAAGKRAKRFRRLAEHEVDKAAFGREEYPYGSTIGDDLRPDKAMQHSHVGIHDADRSGSGASPVDDSAKVWEKS